MPQLLFKMLLTISLNFLDLFMIVYLDDIIFSQSLEEHRVQVKKVLSHLWDHHLYAKAEKCEFEKETIQF